MTHSATNLNGDVFRKGETVIDINNQHVIQEIKGFEWVDEKGVVCAVTEMGTIDIDNLIKWSNE